MSDVDLHSTHIWKKEQRKSERKGAAALREVCSHCYSQQKHLIALVSTGKKPYGVKGKQPTRGSFAWVVIALPPRNIATRTGMQLMSVCTLGKFSNYFESTEICSSYRSNVGNLKFLPGSLSLRILKKAKHSQFELAQNLHSKFGTYLEISETSRLSYLS
jgi:hypothetical protein